MLSYNGILRGEVRTKKKGSEECLLLRKVAQDVRKGERTRGRRMLLKKAFKLWYSWVSEDKEERIARSENSYTLRKNKEKERERSYLVRKARI